MARKRAGLKNFRFHDLRHTFASHLAMNGASLLDIAALLGHKQVKMVQRYAHLLDDYKRLVVEKMARAFLA
jgi:integrase